MTVAERVIQVVSSHYGIPAEKILSSNRTKPVVDARRISWWIIRRSTSCSALKISQQCGGFDPSNILEGIKAIDRRREMRDWFRNETDGLIAACERKSRRLGLHIAYEQSALNSYAEFRTIYRKPPYKYVSGIDREYLKRIAPGM